jgi:pimeloyl-ACP methyl ester carboxylesterase
VQCADQFDPGVRDVVWSNLLGSDPLGAGWGPGVRRAPRWSGWPRGVTWGWNAERAAAVQAPALLISGELDQTVPQQDVRELYGDLHVADKMLIDMACSSHFAMWESRHLIPLRPSLEWLSQGTVDGQAQGTLRLGEN